MKSFAEAYIEEHYIKRGELVILAAIYEKYQNVPARFADISHPIAYHMLPNRPLNVEFDEHGVYMDMTFDNDPVARCQFHWNDIVVIGTAPDQMEMCIANIAMVRSSDDQSIVANQLINIDGLWQSMKQMIAGSSHETTQETKKPSLSLVGGKES